MVNERDDKYDGQEESEYHFSDDQAVYEIEGEAKAPPATNQGTILNKISQYRRPIIGVVVFMVLITIIYVMLAPSSTSQGPTEIGKNVPPPSKVAKPVLPVKVVAQQPVPVQPVALPTIIPPMPVVAAAPPQYIPPQQVQQPTMPMVATPPAPILPAPPTTIITTTTTQQPPVVVQTGAAPTASVTDRVAVLEEQNTKLMTLMQTEYIQKLSEYQEQNNQMRDQMQMINSRMTDIEKNLNRLLQALGGNGGRSAAAEYSTAPVRRPPPTAEVKIAYTVQAIIPGRAWLKSESGETVTVAEGDKLKGIGNIIKIDPYDGVVDIDTGNRIVSLSYGN